MSFTVDLLAGLAQHIATAGIAVYREDGAYTADETGIVIAAIPPAPDRAIVLSSYPIGDDPSLSDSTVAVQVRCRAGADPRDAQALADDVFDLLHGATSLNLGSIRVVQAYRNSGAPLGLDDNNRYEVAENYYLDVWRPSPNRT